MVCAQRRLCACQARNKLAHAALSDVSALILYEPYFLSPLINLVDRFLPVLSTLSGIRDLCPSPLLCGGAVAALRCLLCLYYVYIQ